MSYDLKQRTKAFALRIIKLYEGLPKAIVAQTIGRQVLRSGTNGVLSLHRTIQSCPIFGIVKPVPCRI